MSTTLLQSALSYAARGWPVFPLHNPIGEGQCSCGRPSDPPSKSDRAEGVEYCSSPAKHPRTKFGLKDATTDEQQIREWWHRWPNANIGLPTGAVSFVVIDIDPRHGGDESWQGLVCQFGGIEKIANARTGSGGEHLLFAHPGVKVKNNQSGKLGAGVDVRGDGGYIVAAPSRHVSGGEYAWLTPPNGTLPELPDWLREMMAREPEARPISSGAVSVPEISDNYARKALTEEAAAVASAPEGRRNQQLNDSAYSLGQLVAAGVLYRGDVEQALEAAALQAGLGEVEIRGTLRSGLNAGMREPRQIPEKKTAAAVAVRPRNPEAGPDEVAEFINQLEQAENPNSPAVKSRKPEYWRRSQEGLAREFINRYGDDFRFLSDLTKDGGKNLFAHFDGRKWQMFGPAIAALGKRQREMTGEFREFTQQLLEMADGQMDAMSKEDKAAYAFGLTIESSRWQSDWIKMMRGFDEIHRALAEFDADPYLLNCPNGTVDLRTGELREYRQSDYLSKMTSVEYDPDATCPQWEKFLLDIQSNDQGMVDFLQRGAGYSLTGDPKEECLMICHGVGRNGKGTFLNTLLAILGDYAGSCLMSTFEEKRNDPGANNDLAMLKGLRFVVGSETKEGSRLNEQLVKQVTGRDRLRARFLFSEFFEFVFEGKIWLMVNHLPSIPSTDEGIWSRIRIVPFLRYFKPEERDPLLKEKLMAEAKGILAWAVRGCLAWQKDGLNPPASVTRATEEYRGNQDTIGQFLAECCILGEEHRVTSNLLFRTYTRWAAAHGHKFTLTSNKLGRILDERGFRGDKPGGVATRFGLDVRTDLVHDADDDYDD